MYKFKKNSDVSCCPMGSMHDGIVECYWFGVVRLSDCAKCDVRKDKKFVKKSEE